MPATNLEVTWTRFAKIVGIDSGNTLRLKVDVGFHTWRRVVACITETTFSSPSETCEFVEKWVADHCGFVIRSQQREPDIASSANYLVQVQGTHRLSGESNDLLYDLTRAVRPNSRNPPAKPQTLVVDWTFPAHNSRVVDGDTQEHEADTGFHTDRAITLRLLGVNCPETKGETRAAGLAASEFSRRWYEEHDQLVIQTRKVAKQSVDSFRRYLVTVEGRNTTTRVRESLAQCLLGAHHAVVFRPE